MADLENEKLEQGNIRILDHGYNFRETDSLFFDSHLRADGREFMI